MISQDFLELISSDEFKFIENSKLFSNHCIICKGKTKSDFSKNYYYADCKTTSNCSSIAYLMEESIVNVRYVNIKFAFKIDLSNNIIRVAQWQMYDHLKKELPIHSSRFSFSYDVSKIDLSTFEGLLKFKKYVDKIGLL